MTSSPRLSRALPAAALVLAFALTACGGDDEPTGTSTTSDSTTGDSETSAGETGSAAGSGITKDDFVTRANAICAAGNAELAAAGAAVDQSDPDSIATYATDVLVPNVRGQLDDIRALGFPEADADALDAALTDAGTALDAIEADPTLLTGETNPFADVNTVLDGYGLTDCAS